LAARRPGGQENQTTRPAKLDAHHAHSALTNLYASACAPVAQGIEQRFPKPCAAGSNPAGGTTYPQVRSATVPGLLLAIMANGHEKGTRRRDHGPSLPPRAELDEDIHAGLRREVLEETGYAVEPLRLTGVYKNMPLGVVALVFRCQIVDGNAQPSEETTDVAWVPLRDIPAQLTEAFAIRVLDAVSGSVAVRAHDGRNVSPPVRR
jgi:8-oxo-dGTP diphosphatase